MVTERTHVVPKHVRESTCWLGKSATMDEIEVAATVLPHGPAGAWARSVIDRATERAVPMVASASGELVQGVGDDDEGIITGLAAGGGILLDEKTAVSVRRMLDSGVEQVILRPYAPVAFIRPRHDGSPIVAGAELPENAVEVAIVDELDKNAVIDLLAIAPGPQIFRRHDGQWMQDDGWAHALKSVRPPPMVRLADDQALMASVEQQVDEITAGTPFKPVGKDVDDDPEAGPVQNEDDEPVEAEKPKPAVEPAKPVGKPKPVAASAFLEELERCELDVAVQMALTAAIDVGEMKNPVGTERLRRYWLHGPGAAKIRWFTPGSWSRCVRQLSKYMPPYMVKGYCTNLSQRLGGQGVATHVGVRGAGFKFSQRRRADGTWEDVDGDKTNNGTYYRMKRRSGKTPVKMKRRTSGKTPVKMKRRTSGKTPGKMELRDRDESKTLKAIAEEIRRDPSKKRVYEELARAMKRDPKLREFFEGLQPKRRRS